MTYEEKMLQVLARFRGEALDGATLAAMEAACHAEVWSHLPKPVLRSWRLRLSMSDAQPPQIELHPEHIGLGTAAELEAALRSPFQENPPEPRGGILGVSSHLTGDVNADTRASAPAQPTPREARFEPGTIQFQVGLPPAAPPSKPDASAASASPDIGSLGAEIQAHARELGITFAPGGSLLTAFLEALAVAAEHKARADHLEQKLAAITAALK
ncbi:MAG TPA: hypothetical protein VER11_08515 [Polyangiaceae bacterium]|nr:hypothetical protein [Polyangiaceae bacterium]